jgi:hypothetical protein
MFARRLKIYAVYAKEEVDDPLESTEFVKEGFSIFAGIIPLLWALYHRVWWLAVFAVVFAGASVWALHADVITIVQRGILNIGFLVWAGFSASDFRENALKRRGYVLLGVVTALSEPEAQQRFFDRYLSRPRKKNVALKESSAAA